MTLCLMRPKNGHNITHLGSADSGRTAPAPARRALARWKGDQTAKTMESGHIGTFWYRKFYWCLGFFTDRSEQRLSVFNDLSLVSSVRKKKASGEGKPRIP